MRSSIGISCILLTCFLTPAPVFAHKLLLDCRIKGDRVRVEAFYDDDTPAQQAKVFLENDANQVIAEGRTDERGLWTCALPATGKYTVRAESVGHAAKDRLVVPEPSQGESTKTDPPTKVPTVPVKKSGSFAPSAGGNDNSDATSPRTREETTSTPRTREEKTSTPWLNIAIGFAVIALLCIGAMVIRKRPERNNH